MRTGRTDAPAEEHDMGDPQLLRDVLADDALLVTPEEAAKLLRVRRTTVYALMKTGDLRPVHIGRSCRLPRGELQRYVDGLTTPSSTQPGDSREDSTDESELVDPVHSRSAAS
jgi:excisionase family DNA binding protein